MQGGKPKLMSVPEIIDEIERAEMAFAVLWRADRLSALWQQAKPNGTPDPEWFDPHGEEQVVIDADALKALLREALAAEMIRARARGESTVVIEAGRRRHDA